MRQETISTKTICDTFETIANDINVVKLENHLLSKEEVDNIRDAINIIDAEGGK